MRISDWSSDVCSSDLPMAEIEFSVSNHVAHVRLNRPEALNAITPAMDDLLFDAWRTINDDPEIWCAVLSAEGEKGFCIGGDVSDGAERKSRMALAGGLTGIGGPLVTLKKPLIAAVQGLDRKSTRLNSSHSCASRMQSSA